MARQKSQKVEKTRTRSTDVPQSQPKRHPFHLEFLNQAQKMAWGAFDQHDVLFLLGSAGVGKALTLNSKLYTRNGSILMKDAKIGLEIANPDGGFSKIIGVFPQGKKDVYRVHFSNQTYVDCCKEHLWSVSIDNKVRVVDTNFVIERCRDNSGKRILSIAATKPVNFDRKELEISPYLMGILIAEGNLTNSNVCFSSCEKEIVEHVSCLIDSEYCIKTNGSINHRIVKNKRSGLSNKYKESLKKLGLWGKLSYEKNIPEVYLTGSIDQRIALLQGLMDGDGTIGKENHSMSYSTTSYQLAQDFCQLIYSLGGTTRIKIKEGSRKEDGTRHRVSYRCTVNLPNEINVFFLSRKLRLQKARSKYFPKFYIDRVEKLGQEEMQCIAVDHKDHLYLTDNFTVTHNTHLACAFAISEILAKRKKKIILTRPVIEAGGENLGFLPGDLSEKLNPYMIPLFECMDKMVGTEGPQRDVLNRCVEVAPIAFMRGRTFENAVCIFDEAQNATKSQLKLFMTRFGQNSKIIITGDPKQSDLPHHARGLMDVVSKLEDLPGVGVITFKASSIVRHPLIASILERLEDEEE